MYAKSMPTPVSLFCAHNLGVQQPSIRKLCVEEAHSASAGQECVALHHSHSLLGGLSSLE